ncbi:MULTISPECIES: GrpB family protein [Shewanella]|nr:MULTISPECIES: GrpB family protein [Shewanella]
MKPIMIVEPKLEWSNEFDAIAQRIRVFVGAEVQRMDHIGSTL